MSSNRSKQVCHLVPYKKIHSLNRLGKFVRVKPHTDAKYFLRKPGTILFQNVKLAT